jgi:hypothetical protein
MREEVIEEVQVEVKKKPKDTVKPKGKVGRPKRAIPKDKGVMSYFTEEEHNRLSALAEELGYSLSNLVRRAALKALKEPK